MYKYFYNLLYLLFLFSLILISYLITILLIDYSDSNKFIFYNKILLIIIFIFVFCLFYVLKFSKSKFKDTSLMIIFLGLGGSSRHFDLYFINYFHILFFSGILFLFSYIVYEKKFEKS